MTPEIGNFALALALVVALLQAVLPLWGAARGNARLMAFADAAAQAQLVLSATAFFALMHAQLVSDFSVRNVAENSHTLKPLLYKITGVWGSHEGSMLLWVLILAVFGAALATFGRGADDGLRARTLSVQAMVSTAFLAFILFAANPFQRVFPPPLEGNDLNPILQDPGLAFHPPLLYLGYVGFSLVFAFAAGGLISGRIDEAWARAVRPWTLAAWCALTLGIALGSWWAYYELGWGGFWFWDPVENASLMPWLAGTALVHSVTVLEKRGALAGWTVLLAILTFALSLIGTFLVRSGVLTSVHTFATDPTRGLFILAIIALALGGAFGLFALRAPKLAPGRGFTPMSREGLLLINNLLLATLMVTVFVGTLYPLALEAVTGEKISVGAPYFTVFFLPLAALLLVLVPIGAGAPWKRAEMGAVLVSLGPALAAALACVALAAVLGPARTAFAFLGFGLAGWLLGASVLEIWRRARGFSGGARAGFARLGAVPLATYGMVVAHAGLGIVALGITGVGTGRLEAIASLAPGEAVALGGASLTLERVITIEGPNYQAERGVVTLKRAGAASETLFPERRLYPSQKRVTTEAAIRTSLLGDIYVVLGEAQKGTPQRYAMRAYLNPFAPWIWLGAGVMALGGAFSLVARFARVRRGRAVVADTQASHV